MVRHLWPWAALSLLAGCYLSEPPEEQHGPAVGSESHFLRACEDACPGELSCMGGVCTLPCESDDACAFLGDAARCPAPDDVPAQPRCDRTCALDADCDALGEGFSCYAGLCRESDPEMPQQDAPLVMILLDTSGSMERLAGCECETPGCEECLPDCDAGERSRFTVALEALTGTWEDFSCEAQDRLDESFTYDRGYYLPHHRPPVDEPQLADGVLDEFRHRVRFGIATFDSFDTYVGAPPLVPVSDFSWTLSQGEEGLWSYGTVVDGFPKLDADGRPRGTFHYPGCVTNYLMDTGIRGPQAPVGAVRHSQGVDDMVDVNAAIQRDLLRVRPYGGTPIASALDDLRTYFDQNPPPSLEDPDEVARQVILITDGYPDDDYRSFGCDCASSDDPNACGDEPPDEQFCPYPAPEEAAAAFGPGAPFSPLHVVVFSQTDPQVLDRADEIASAGGSGQAARASTTDELREALREIIDPLL
jgi:hypothetical protein